VSEIFYDNKEEGMARRMTGEETNERGGQE
jgi:hypothetical protein